MAKQETQKNENQGQELSLPMVIRAQYVKDLSFENPNPLGAFSSTSTTTPNISVDVQVKAQNLGNGNFEVILEFKASGKRDTDTLFVVELDYAGVISVAQELSEQEVERYVMVEAPTLLFPFARGIVADATRDGGYPPLFITPINFEALFAQQQQAMASEKKSASA